MGKEKTIKIELSESHMKSLMEKLIHEHRRLFGHEENDYTNGAERLEEIVVAYESRAEEIQQFAQNFLKEAKQKILNEHVDQQHLSSLQAQFKAAFMRFSERKDQIINEKSHISRKYDLLLARYKQTTQKLSNQQQKNNELKEQLNKETEEIQFLNKKNDECLEIIKKYKNENDDLSDSLSKNLQELQYAKNFLKKQEQMMKSSENYYKQTLKKLSQDIYLTNKRIIQQKESQFQQEQYKLKKQSEKYKEWFQMLVDDISYLIQYKKTSEIQYEQWMQKYQQLEMRDRIFKKDSNKAEHRLGILKDNIIGADYDFIIDQEDRYQQLMKKIDSYMTD